jgi:adenosylmethionine-8-amino-7-oxononanoate aminotransferase
MTRGPFKPSFGLSGAVPSLDVFEGRGFRLPTFWTLDSVLPPGPHFSRAFCARSGVLPSTTECDNSQVPDSTTPPRSPVLRRSFRKDFPAAVRGEGVYLWDAANTKYLDFSGSAAVNFIGHGVPEISAAMTAQASRLEFVHTSQFTTPVAEAYAEEVLAFAGESFRGGAVYFTSGGSESIETALKLARQYQVEIGESRRYQILSRQQSYHGSTLGALSVSGNQRRREIYVPMIREFAHVGTPYCYRCAFDCTDSCRNCGQQYAAELDRAIAASDGEAAAFIFEPLSGATLGAVVPPPGYLQSIAEICRRHGVLLIADEVMTGMGRTGRNFAVEHWLGQNLDEKNENEKSKNEKNRSEKNKNEKNGKKNIPPRRNPSPAPDILVTAKGLSSGYAPLGAVIASKKVIDAIANGSGAFLHGFTYNAHPISLAAGHAVLKHLQSTNLIAAADSTRPGTVAAHLKQALQSLLDQDPRSADPRSADRLSDARHSSKAHRVIGDVRGLGLLWAVEFVADQSSKRPFPAELNFAGRVAAAAMHRGLLVYPMQGCVDGTSGDHLLLAPPAVITQEEITWSVTQLRAAVDEAASSLR